MSFPILADEGLNGNIVRLLRASGFSVKWVLEDNSGISDNEVMLLAKSEHRILITEDKDFGEWIFAHRETGLTIILLRYTKRDIDVVVQQLLTALDRLRIPDFFDRSFFVVINRSRIRIRAI